MEILEELLNKKPEELEGESKKLFEAIMKIVDERDEYLKELEELKEKIEDIIEDVNIESYNELVNVFLEISKIIENEE